MKDRGGLSWTEYLLSLLLFTLVICCLFHDVVLGDRTVSSSPNISFTTPDGPVGYHYTGRIPFFDVWGPSHIHEANFPLRVRALNAGQLPFWHPHEACGNPYFAGYLPGLLYPPNWLMHLGSPPLGFDIAYLARLVLSGWLVFLFLRAHGVSRTAAFLSGVVFLSSGRFLGGFNLSSICVEGLTPGLLLGLERLIVRRLKRDLVLTIIMVLGLLLAGNPQAAFLALALGAVYSFFRVLSILPSGRLNRLGLVLLAYLLGALLAAPQILPFLELLSLAQHGHGAGRIFSHLPWETLVIWVVPEFFRNVYDGIVMPSTGGIFGQATLAWALAAAAFFSRRHRFLRRVVVVGGIILAAWYFGVPGFRNLSQLPVINRIALVRYLLGPLSLLAALLAGIGLDILTRSCRPERRIALGCAIAGVVPVIYIILWATGSLAGYTGGTLRLGQSDPVDPHLGLIPILLLAALGAGVWAAWRPSFRRFLPGAMVILTLVEISTHRPDVYPLRKDIYRQPDFLTGLPEDRSTYRIYSPDRLLRPNTATIFRLNDIRCAENLVVDRYYRLIKQAFDLDAMAPYFIRKDDPPRTPGHILSLLCVKYVLTSGVLEPIGTAQISGGARHEETVVPQKSCAILTGELVGANRPVESVRVWVTDPDSTSILDVRNLAELEKPFKVRLRPGSDATDRLYYLGLSGVGSRRLEIESITWCGQPISHEMLRSGSYDPGRLAAQVDGGVSIVTPPCIIALPDVVTDGIPELVMNGRVTGGTPVQLGLIGQAGQPISLTVAPAGESSDRASGRTVSRFQADMSEYAGRKTLLSIQGPDGSTLTRIGFEPPGFVQRARHGIVRTYENLQALPRAFGVYRKESVSGDDAERNRILDPAFPLRTTVLLEPETGDLALPDPPPETAPEVKWIREESTGRELELEAEFAAPGLLVLHDNYYPGWLAFVDGKPTRILRANYTFRAVSVPAGIHRIRFVYRSRFWTIGLLTAAAAVAVLLLLLWRWPRKAARSIDCSPAL